MVMLNSTLPEDIRVLTWAPVDSNFSARFNCLHRTYKYFFPKGNMDINVSLRHTYNFLLCSLANIIIGNESSCTEICRRA